MSAPYDAFLCGPITGVEDFKDLFIHAQIALHKHHLVNEGRAIHTWNPALLPEGQPYEWYMHQCVTALFASPSCVVYLLPGWETSKGARAEHALAVSLGRDIRHFTEGGAH